MSHNAFKEALEEGHRGESLIQDYFIRARGCAVLPIHNEENIDFKGPRFFTPDGELVAPDLLVFGKQGVIWVEAKHKSVFSWHRISGKWVPGVDLHHYEHYQEIAEKYPFPVWILFLHKYDYCDERDEPWPCPTGLFGQDIGHLRKNENHRHGNHGRSGMVYWGVDTFKKIATVDDVMACQEVCAVA